MNLLLYIFEFIINKEIKFKFQNFIQSIYRKKFVVGFHIFQKRTAKLIPHWPR